MNDASISMGATLGASRKKAFAVLYASSLLYAIHFALPLYINSSFLGVIANEKFVGLIFALAHLVTLFFLPSVPKIFQKYGLRKTLLFFISLEFLVLFALGYFSSPIIIIWAFVLLQVTVNSLFLSLDELVEVHSKDAVTGSIRGVFLTLLSTGVFIAPIITSFLVGDGDFSKIYLVAALFLLPLFFLVAFLLPPFSEPYLEDTSLARSIQRIFREGDLRNIFFSYFLLQFFYAWMIIYTPIYLNKVIGLSFAEIFGVILPVALLPFILFQYVAGFLADKKYGEKEILIAGFFIGAVATASLTFIASASVVLWAGILFLTRVGASLIEIMSETYFYKKVSGNDAELISDWRNISPLAFIIAPVIATVLQGVFGLPLSSLFAILGLILLSGVFFASRLKDTN